MGSRSVLSGSEVFLWHFEPAAGASCEGRDPSCEGQNAVAMLCDAAATPCEVVVKLWEVSPESCEVLAKLCDVPPDPCPMLLVLEVRFPALWK